jgi:hypothetical protein
MGLQGGPLLNEPKLRLSQASTQRRADRELGNELEFAGP